MKTVCTKQNFELLLQSTRNEAEKPEKNEKQSRFIAKIGKIKQFLQYVDFQIFKSNLHCFGNKKKTNRAKISMKSALDFSEIIGTFQPNH